MAGEGVEGLSFKVYCYITEGVGGGEELGALGVEERALSHYLPEMKVETFSLDTQIGP